MSVTAFLSSVSLSSTSSNLKVVLETPPNPTQGGRKGREKEEGGREGREGWEGQRKRDRNKMKQEENPSSCSPTQFLTV